MDAEMSELAGLASGESGADPLEQIFNLTIKYNDYLEAKKKDPGLTDAYLDPMMDRLDDIIGSKRRVKITIKYEGDESTTTLLPVTWLIFIPLLKIRRKSRPEPEPTLETKPEPTPIELEPKPEPKPEPELEPPSMPEPPPTPEDKDKEQEVWIRDLYIYFDDPDTLRRGLNYKAIADSLDMDVRHRVFNTDDERVDCGLFS